MKIYDTYEGNARDGSFEDGRAVVTVDGDQRRRSRFRTTTDGGREVGVVVGRELRAGDVLSAADGSLVEIALEPVEAVVVDLADAAADLAGAVALGHAAGNRHWDMAIRDDEVLFPAAESDEHIDATLSPHLPAGADVRREQVSPALFDGDVGPTAGHGHAHPGGHAHDHSHGGGGHSHDDHGSGGGHTHGNGADGA